MNRTRRPAILAVVATAALAIGVTAAWAGFPNFRTVDSTFDAGTATKGGGKTATVESARVLAAAVEAPSSAAAVIYVHFSAVGVSRTPEFVPYAEGTQAWACANGGGGWPADPKKFEGPVGILGSQLSLTADRNGKIVYSGDGLSILLASPEGFSCPSGQTALLVGLNLSKLVLRVVGFDEEEAVDYPTSDGWTGNVFARPGYPG
ncbi:MAG: hypothetical protein H0V20_01875 [Actinobacteria bacterium]|nr:hypothetical protein [Actinomycetota bacterium]